MLVPQRCLPLAIVALLLARCVTGWIIEDVDTPVSLADSSLKLAPGGELGIAFGANALYYARFDGTTLVREVVDAASCQGNYERSVSLAFDSLGLPAIAYASQSTRELRLARGGAGWGIETLDVGVTAVSPSLAFALDGTALVAYHDRQQGELKLARSGPAGISVEVIASVGVRGLSLALSGDQPVIAYGDATNQDLRLARFDGSSWTIVPLEAVGTNYPVDPALVIDVAGHEVVSYGGGMSAQVLKVARFDGVAWTFETVAAGTAQFSSVTLDAAGRPVVSYQSNRAGLKVARWNGSTWTVDAVESGSNVGSLTAIALDAASGLDVTYFNRDQSELRLARFDGSLWTVRTLEVSEPSSGASLAFDPGGHPAIAHGMEGNRVRFSRFDGTSWRHEDIDSSGSDGFRLSLAYDSAGHPAIAYLSRPVVGDPGRLKVARWDGSGWSSTTVDSAGNTGYFPSLAASAGGGLVVAYTSFPGDLRVARFDGAAWQTEIVTTGEGEPSLALGPGGLPAVAYSGFGVKFARYDGSSWQIESLGNGAGASLAFDPAGKPLIAYRQPFVGVYLAAWDGSSWNIENVDPDESSGSVSLSVDAAGSPGVAYQENSGEVRLARRDGASWQIDTLLSPTSFAVPSLKFLGVAPWVAVGTSCTGYLQLLHGAVPPVTALYRGVVPSLGGGWRATALPLTSVNDDPTPPFPDPAASPGSRSDDPPAGAALVLYRFLGAGDSDQGNVLRVTRSGNGSLVLHF